MSFDLYKKRMMGNGGNIVSERVKDSRLFISQNFKDDPSYKSAILHKLDLSQESIDIRIKNIDRTTAEKRFLFLPDTEIEVGSYIEYDGKYYLIMEFQDENVISPYSVAKFCNQIITFKNDIKIPAVVEGESYGVKIFQGNNDFNTAVDTKVNITIGDTILNRKLFKINTRVMTGNSKYGIYKIGDLTYYKKGLTICTCKKDKYLEDLDNVQKGICWQEEDDGQTISEYKIKGASEIKVGTYEKYEIYPNDTEVEFIIPEEMILNGVIEYDNIDDKSISIKALIPNELIKIKCKINGMNIEKNILTVR